MKVMQRGIMKILPGKMGEAMQLMEKHMALMARLGQSDVPMRRYAPFLGGGDALHTMIFEVEWDSFAEMAAFFEKTMADPEMQALMPQWAAIEQSHEVELYMVMG